MRSDWRRLDPTPRVDWHTSRPPPACCIAVDDSAGAGLADLALPSCAEHDDDRVGILDGGQARGRIGDVALDDLQPVVLDGDSRRVAGERRHVVPMGERLLDQGRPMVPVAPKTVMFMMTPLWWWW